MIQIFTVMFQMFLFDQGDIRLKKTEKQEFSVSSLVGSASLFPQMVPTHFHEHDPVKWLRNTHCDINCDGATDAPLINPVMCNVSVFSVNSHGVIATIFRAELSIFLAGFQRRV